MTILEETSGRWAKSGEQECSPYMGLGAEARFIVDPHAAMNGRSFTLGWGCRSPRLLS